MNILRPIFLFLFALILIRTIEAQTIVTGGYVSGNWDVAHSPYLVDGDLLIHADSTLAISEGTIVRFRGHYRLEIQGQLTVSGTPDLPVIFGADTGVDFWQGLHFNTTDTSVTDSSRLEHGTISECEQYGCLNIDHSSRLRVSDFIMENGNSFRGGGISCYNSDPILENLLVQDNVALDGAGISLEQSNPVIRNCIISNNSADGAGGGIVIFNLSAPLIENCTISGNYSYGSGGGIYINDSWPIFRNCSISGNDGAHGSGNLYSGGGVSVKLDSHPYFENCSFADNSTEREGGAIASFSPTELVDCLFDANSAGTYGGAVFLSSGSQVYSHLTNCTFFANDCAKGTALAIHTQTAIILNCILWHPDPLNPGSLIYLDSPLSLNLMDINYSDIQNGQSGIERADNEQYTWGIGNISLDPFFMPGSEELSWQSPCIEAGNPDTTGLYLPELDLAGNLRLANDRVDMGAYEYQLPLSVQSSKFKVQSEVIIYPNPGKDRFYVAISDQLPVSYYQIFNSNGELVLSGHLNSESDKVEVNISGFEPGVYLIKFQGDDITITKKIITID